MTSPTRIRTNSLLLFSSDVENIPYLRGKNDYTEWVQGLRAHLLQHDLLDHLHADNPCPLHPVDRLLDTSPAPDLEQYERSVLRYNAWHKDESVVRLIIKATVAPRIAERLDGMAHEMYNHINKNFKPDPFRVWMDTRWEGQEDRKEFVGRWQEAKDAVNAAGNHVSNHIANAVFISAVTYANYHSSTSFARKIIDLTNPHPNDLMRIFIEGS